MCVWALFLFQDLNEITPATLGPIYQRVSFFLSFRVGENLKSDSVVMRTFMGLCWGFPLQHGVFSSTETENLKDRLNGRRWLFFFLNKSAHLQVRLIY